MSKAFDTINIHTLIRKLLQTNIPGTIIEFIANYIKGRKVYTTYRNHTSRQRQFKTGVSQGGVLSPTLFNICTSDLPTPSAPVQVMAYADDITITSTHTQARVQPRNIYNHTYIPYRPAITNCKKKTVEENVSNELNKVNSWLSLNQLSLNTDKTKCMTSHTRQKNIDQLTFSINGNQIENVKFFKFLGIMFDEHLTWKNHITMITNKLSIVIRILNRLKNIYPQQALLSIYNALFLSHMTYGLLLWGNQAERVSKLQKKSIRLITSSEYLAHSEPLFKELE